MNASVASTSGIFTIELYAFPNKTWVYDMGCGTHICNTLQGLRESRKLKHEALSLYMSIRMRAATETIRSFDLILPSGLIILLENCHFAPYVTRGVFSISRLVNNGYIHTFTNYGISVSKDNVFNFIVIPRDGIYEIDMHNLYLNVSSMFNVSNKISKHALDSSYLWHCHLGHINKKSMDKLQRDGILQPTHDESLEKSKSCISGKMNEVENQLGKKIKAIRFNRGGEYPSHEFVNHMNSYGIVSQLTPPYTPQHNKVFERKNQTLLDMLRYMMNLTTLPKSYWGYALESAACILNTVPTKKVERTAYEIWHEKAPKLSYLRVWGCEGLVKRDAPKKLNPRSIKSMNTKMQSMKDNQVWVLVDLPPNCQNVGSKWLFKKKTDMDGEATYILGIKIIHDRSKWLIALSQSAYLKKILKRFWMENSKKGYTSMIEKHDYRKSQGAKTPSEQNPSEINWTVVKAIFKYLRNSKDMVLVYGGKPEAELKVSCYVDASFQTDKDDTKSQMGYVFVLNGGVVDWVSAKQSTTVMSSTEAEYIAAAEASMEAVWMRKFIDGLGGVVPSNKRPMEMLCNNELAIAIANDPDTWEVVTTCERSPVRVSSWEFSFKGLPSRINDRDYHVESVDVEERMGGLDLKRFERESGGVHILVMER
nr:hypothetical protein [Tanacetum cinerariifolium]